MLAISENEIMKMSDYGFIRIKVLSNAVEYMEAQYNWNAIPELNNITIIKE